MLQILSNYRLLIAACLLVLIPTIKCIPSMMKTLSKSLDSHRLPANIKPEHYNLSLSIDGTERIIDGLVEIKILMEKPIEYCPIDKRSSSSRFRFNFCAVLPREKDDNPYQEMSEPDTRHETPDTRQDRIVLNVGPSVKIESVKFFEFIDQNLNSVQKKETKNSYAFDKSKQLMVIDIKRKAGNKGGLLSLKFKSKLRNDLRGVSLHSRADYGSFIISKFQPTDARLAFPCFDEPQFKANISLAVRHDSKMQALSNMPVKDSKEVPSKPKFTETKFYTTPKMSVHMLSFAVGNFESFDGQIESISGREIPVKIHTPEGLRNSAEFALEVASKSLQWMEEYTNIAYPLEKFDLITVFEHEKDNYESWGLTFVRANLALFDQETKEDSKITIAVNVAHVVAHQWFANLITAKWWDSLWITEMFAAQMAFEMVKKLYPEFESDYFVRLSTLSGVLQMDSRIENGLHPLSPNPDDLVTPEQINTIFDNLTFMKGASLAQLLANQKNFLREALRDLLEQHKYNNIDKEDLALVLQSTAGTNRNSMDNYASQLYSPSYPVINLDQKDDRIFLTLTKVKATELGLSIKFGGPTSSSFMERSIVTADQELALPQGFNLQDDNYWLKLNFQPDISTYFRVNYSESLINSHLRNAIENKKYYPLDRLHLLDDAIGLFKSGEMSLHKFNQLLDCYKKETHGGVIMGLVVASKVLLELGASNSAINQVLIDIFRRYKSRYGSHSFVNQRALMSAWGLLIKMGNEEAIQEALKKFDENNGLVEVYLREPIYVAVVKHGIETQVARLRQHLKETKSLEEKARLKNALEIRGHLSGGGSPARRSLISRNRLWNKQRVEG